LPAFMEFNGKRVLITGAAGFIGSNLTRQLLGRGATVHAVVRPSSSLWRLSDVASAIGLHCADLTDRGGIEKILDQVRPEIIFHLAVRGMRTYNEDPCDILRVNVFGTVNLLEAAKTRDHECLVHLGSSTEYGPKNSPMKESDCLEPATFYGATKAASTLFCLQAAAANRRPIVVLRPFNVYGPWDVGTRLIPVSVMAALQGGGMDVTPAGYRRDYVFVEDVCEACLMAADSKEAFGRVLNIGTGRQWSNEEVVETVQTLAGKRIAVRAGEYPLRPFDVKRWEADISEAKRLLGWEPRHTLEQGLKKTIAWFDINRDRYAREGSS